MTHDRPPVAGPAPPEYVLDVIRDSHRQQCQFDPEADPDAVLTFETTVAEWRDACDLLAWRPLGRALDRLWSLDRDAAAWRSVLEPAKKNVFYEMFAISSLPARPDRGTTERNQRGARPTPPLQPPGRGVGPPARLAWGAVVEHLAERRGQVWENDAMKTGSIDRRDFLRGSLALAAATALGRGAKAATTAAAAKTGPYIDVHTHLGRTWNGDAPLSAEELVQWMDEHNVAKAVVLPLVSPESSSYLNLTEQALAGAKAFPDRLIAFCCIDPRTSYSGGRKGLVAMLKEYVDQGVKGLGEFKVGLPIDDPRSMKVYEACDDLKLPVLFHCDNLRNTDKAGLPGLDRVLSAFPNVNFLGHGPGFWASISGDLKDDGFGGYPKTKVAPGGALDQLFDAHKNLWGDMSAGSGANGITRDLEFGREFLIRRADRLMFGTDYLKVGQPVPQFELFATIDLPDDVRAKIERDNAANLLNIKI